MALLAGTSLLREEAAAWTFLHHLFRFPSEAQWAWLREPNTASGVRLLAAARGGPQLGPCGGKPPHSTSDVPLAVRVLSLPPDFAQYQEEYLSVFEVGAPTPPCPLIESHWNKREPVPRILHENILFYRRFGLSLRRAANETADHLRHQLEFMSYLCLRECEGGDADGGLAAARRDFVSRHLAWTRAAAQKLEADAPDHWATAWMECAASFVSGVQTSVCVLAG